MTIQFTTRSSDSPYIESVISGRTLRAGAPTRPAETNWHMVFIRAQGFSRLVLAGPQTSSGVVTYDAGAEILWVKLRLGVYLTPLPPKALLDNETSLPDAGERAFWLNGCAWQYPDAENVETFISRLAHDEILLRDPLVVDLLQGRPRATSPRTVRHHFLHATGQTQAHIRQFQRAQQAAALLGQGSAILDVVDQLGYFDQPHLTRSLRRFLGATPAQLLNSSG